jgi:hypothetical protein
MRPVYESSFDIERETSAMAQVASVFGGKPNKTPKFSQIDYTLSRANGEITSFFEVKCRNNPKDKYPTLLLSLHKFMNLVEQTDTTGLPAYVVAAWTDGLYIFQVSRIDTELFDIKKGGRYDRNDPKDVELVIHIPIDLFKPLNSFKTNE